MNQIVLMYHCVYANDRKETGFQSSGANVYKLSAIEFEKQVKAIRETYPIDCPVVFTFDDGGVSFYSVIAPILEKYHFKGYFFISTDYIGTNGFLSAEQILNLHTRGHVIGSHSCSHPSRMIDLDDETLLKEWVESCKTLSGIIGEDIKVASIPNGYSNKSIIQAMLNAGILQIYTSEPTDKIRNIEKHIQIIGRYAILSSMSTQNVLSIVNNKNVRRKLLVRSLGLEIVKKILGKSYVIIREKLLKH